MVAHDQAAPGVYDPLETVSYFKYCITPHPLESHVKKMQWVTSTLKNICHKMRYKNYVPHVPQIEVQFEVQIRVHWGKSIQI